MNTPATPSVGHAARVGPAVTRRSTPREDGASSALARRSAEFLDRDLPRRADSRPLRWAKTTVGVVAGGVLALVGTLALYPVFLFFLPFMVLGPLALPVVLFLPVALPFMPSMPTTWFRETQSGNVRCVSVYRRSERAPETVSTAEMVAQVEVAVEEEPESARQAPDEVRALERMPPKGPLVRVAPRWSSIPPPRVSDVFVRARGEPAEEEKRRTAGE